MKTASSERDSRKSRTSYGIDYDFRSQHRVLASLEPLLALHRKVLKVHNIKVFTSPSGRGWHVRFDLVWLNLPIPRRVIELLGGDDPWRHVYSLLRDEGDNAPLFEVKIKQCKECKFEYVMKEKYNEQMTKRVREMFK